MKNSYLVHTKGKVIDDKYTSYAITANSKSEALKVAKKKFISENSLSDSNIGYIVDQRDNSKLIFSLICILGAIFLASRIWAPPTGHEVFSISPKIPSMIFSLAFYSIFVIRIKGIKRSFKTWLDIGFAFSIMYLLSSIIQIILVTKHLKLLWIIDIPVDSFVILTGALVLSLIGLKFVSLLCYLGIGILALSNITALSEAMGFWGPIFLLLSYFGLLSYIIHDIDLSNSIPEIVGSFKKGVNYVHNDFIEGGKQFEEYRDATSEKMDNLIDKG